MTEPTLAELEEQFPYKPWRVPVRIRFGSDAWRYACRICVHNRGLHNDEIAELPSEPDEITLHIQTEHATTKDEK